MKYPGKINNLIEFYRSLPGIGEKNAIRLALATYDMSSDKLFEISKDLQDLKTSVKKCSVCGNISENDICDICQDPNRDHNTICVLEDFKSVFSFEKSNIFNGTYHVLGGLISPMDNINPDNLNIESLVNRVKKIQHPEVIIALTSSIEGEMTMLYLKKILSEYNVKVTRLSYGVPLGMNLDYMDMLSLNKALEDRREIEDES